jgi:hypothetical protein
MRSPFECSLVFGSVSLHHSRGAECGVSRANRRNYLELEVPLAAAVFIAYQLLNALMRQRIQYSIGVPRRTKSLPL